MRGDTDRIGAKLLGGILTNILANQHALGLIVLLPSHDNIGAAGQRLADGLILLPTHDDRLAQRQAAEPPQVGGQVPRDAAVVADQQVAVDGDQERHDHTATSPASRP